MIEQTAVDGIPTLLAPGTGPARGGITFRVGRADETLARSGITHLVEHLALHRLGLTDYHYNGTTGPTVTHFFSQGSPEAIGEYLTSVCTALRDLPWHRLDVEKEVLRTESASRSQSPVEPLLLWRYGARGYGLSSYPEWGLTEITADEIRAWVARYFTRENAVLWFSGIAAPPRPHAPDARRSTKPRRFRRLTVAMAIVLGVLSAFCALFSALVIHSVLTDPDPQYGDTTRAVVVAVFWAATALVVVPCILLVRRLR